MSTITRRNPFVALAKIFASGVDIEDNNIELDKVQLDSQSKADGMMEKSSEAINVNNGKRNKLGGFVKKMDTNPEIGKAMREQHDEIVKSQEEREL